MTLKRTNKKEIIHFKEAVNSIKNMESKKGSDLDKFVLNIGKYEEGIEEFMR